MTHAGSHAPQGTANKTSTSAAGEPGVGKQHINKRSRHEISNASRSRRAWAGKQHINKRSGHAANKACINKRRRKEELTNVLKARKTQRHMSKNGSKQNTSKRSMQARSTQARKLGLEEDNEEQQNQNMVYLA